jgi:N-acyl-phosphatidylethanolamine-hydrolysing phospholipase D
MLWLWLLLPVCLIVCSCCHQVPFSDGEWRRTTSAQDPAKVYDPHRNGDRYYNPWLPMKEYGFRELLRWRFSGKQPYSEQEKGYLPRVLPDTRGRVENHREGDFIVWIGHATFLIRINGQYWLTDPVFSERVLLPKRQTAPAMTLEDLAMLAPHINVIISHNHYDHFDKATIERLPPSARFFVPPGLGGHLKKLGRNDVTELDWWHQVDCGDSVNLVSLPVQHWSRRLGQPFNTTLWASYLLVTPSLKIYYGADGGYFVGYREIGRRYPDIDYAIMPATAYHPRWFMHYSHMNAEESIDAFEDLGARYFIPLGWGTFQLGDEPAGYPAFDLRRVVESRRLDPMRFRIMDIGEILPVTGIDRHDPLSAKAGRPQPLDAQ